MCWLEALSYLGLVFNRVNLSFMFLQFCIKCVPAFFLQHTEIAATG